MGADSDELEIVRSLTIDVTVTSCSLVLHGVLAMGLLAMGHGMIYDLERGQLAAAAYTAGPCVLA